jgi:alpha-1,2-mannosyltransferase
MSLKRWHFEALAAVAALATFAAMATQLAGGKGLLLGNGMPMFGDFLAFWSAGKLALEGHAAAVYNDQAIMWAHHQVFPGFDRYFPWRSPPPFLLVMTPLAIAPYGIAALIFLAATFALFLYGLRKLLPDNRALLLAVTSPASVLQIGSVQLSFAITGLTSLALHWLNKRPIAAGAAIAALSVKPHLAVLWPVMLAVQGRWRAFLAAAGFTAALAFVAGLVFGFDTYAGFVQGLGEANTLVETLGLPPNTLASIYANLTYMHAPEPVAIAIHALSAAAAVTICVLIWRSRDDAASGAALAAATLLISPYLFFYDTLLLSISVALLARGKQGAWAIAVYVLAFAVGGAFLWVGRFITLPLCPAAAWAMLLLAYSRVTRTESVAAQPA